MMKNKSALFFSVLACVAITTVPLAGCTVSESLSSDSGSTKTKTHAIDRIKALVAQKNDLSEELFHLQDQKTIALNQGDFKQLNQLKDPLFKTQAKLTTVTNQVTLFNKMLRHSYHQAVLDNGEVIDTWKLLKTDDSDSNHQRAHTLIQKLKKLQSQQQAVNEALWSDQNYLTHALNQNNPKQVEKYESQYFKDRMTALPIANQIDMLTIQIAKFTQDLGKPTATIHSSRTFDDWVIYQTVANNNQSLNHAVTPTNPNDDLDDNTNHPSDDDDTNHTGTASDNPSHSTDSDTGHTATDDGGTGHATDGGDGGGHAGGDAGGGGGHGGE